MSDLISRSDVLKLPRYNFGTSVSMLTLEEYIKVSDIKKILTAYSVDKVVEELELHSFELGTDALPVHYVRLNEAIEIVKQGGDANNICEWKQDNMCETVYRVCDGFSTTAYQTDFKFCPYCGKKIKIVGD